MTEGTITSSPYFIFCFIYRHEKHLTMIPKKANQVWQTKCRSLIFCPEPVKSAVLCLTSYLNYWIIRIGKYIKKSIRKGIKNVIKIIRGNIKTCNEFSILKKAWVCKATLIIQVSSCVSGLRINFYLRLATMYSSRKIAWALHSVAYSS